MTGLRSTVALAAAQALEGQGFIDAAAQLLEANAGLSLQKSLAAAEACLRVALARVCPPTQTPFVLFNSLNLFSQYCVHGDSRKGGRKVRGGKVQGGRLEGGRVEGGRVKRRRLEGGRVKRGRLEGGRVEAERLKGGRLKGGRLEGGRRGGGRLCSQC